MKDAEIQLSPQTSSSFPDLLFTLAGPAIYRQNAFRALALPVDSTSQRLLRQADFLRISTKLGGTEPALQGPLLLKPLPIADEVNQFVRRYRDPQIRLIDEFFWFWPEEFGKSSDDEALTALGQGDLSGAVSAWRAREDTPGQGFIARHNLAVLYHTAALDLEHLDRSQPLSTVQIQQRDRYWQEALSRWGSVISAREMWDYISLRITNLDDPRIPVEAALELEAHLAGSVLAINAKLAVAAAEKRLEAEALRHARQLLDSRFPADSIEKAVQQGTAMIRRLVKAACGGAEPEAKAKPEKAHAVAKRVLGQTSGLTVLLDSWRAKDDAVLVGMHDEIALCALNCEIAFVNETRQWQESIEVFETCLELAASDSARQRIEKSLSTVKANATEVQLRARQTLIDPLAERIVGFCAESSPETRFEQLAKLARCELKNIIDQRGEGDEISNEASNLLARAMLACATDLIDNGMFQTAKEALILAKEICRDPDLYSELEGECHRLDSKIEENEAQFAQASYLPLIEMASPELYRLNAFRLTGLPVDANQQMVSRQVEKLKMMEQLGVVDQQNSSHPVLGPSPDVHAVSEAIQRLRDPERRLLEEIFWFWPVEPEAGSMDLALAALEKGSIDLAWDNWTRLENGGTAGVIATHNLAVLAHVLALDLEYQTKTSPVSKANKRDYYWLEAVKRWRLLTRDRDFWKLVANRISRLNDPRVTPDLVPQLRASLPLAILSINAQLAVAAAEQGKTFDAQRLLEIMKRWIVDPGHQLFSADGSVEDSFLGSIERALQNAIAPLQERIKMACQAAEEGATANPASAVQTARILLDQTSSMLEVLKCLLPENHPTRTGHHDQVALQARSCVIANSKTTEHSPEVCRKLLEECVTLAATESARKRLTKDLAELDEYVESQEIKKWIDPIAADLRTTFELEVSLSAKYYRLRDLSKRHLNALRSQLGEGAQAFSIASNLLAQALRRISIELHNEERRYELSYEAIKLALSLARDPETKAKLNEDFGTIQEHAEQEKLYKDLTPIKSAPGLWSIKGFGTTLYGNSDSDSKTNSFITCLYIICLFIPVFPIARYRVIRTSDKAYRCLGKARLKTLDQWHRAIAAIILFVFIGSSFTSQREISGTKESQAAAPVSPYSLPGSTANPANSVVPKVPSGMRRISHQVGKGETVESIAATYSTTGDAVRKWNNLPARYQPQFGALLKVFLPDSEKKRKTGHQIPDAAELQDLPIESPAVIYQPPSLATLPSSDRAVLEQELEAERPRLEKMKSELGQMAQQIGSCGAQIDFYKKTLTRFKREHEMGSPVDRDEYERVRDNHNSYVAKRNALLEDYRANDALLDRRLAEFNEKVGVYNQLR